MISKSGSSTLMAKAEDEEGERNAILLARARRASLVGSVEIWWAGSVQLCCFPVPPETRYLTQKTKDNFLDSVRLETTPNRIRALIDEMDRFVVEMEWVARLAEYSSLFRILEQNQNTFAVVVRFFFF